MHLGDASEEVAGADPEVVGGIGGRNLGEQLGGAVEITVGFGLEIDERDGFAETGFAVAGRQGGKGAMGVLKKTERSLVPWGGVRRGFGGERGNRERESDEKAERHGRLLEHFDDLAEPEISRRRAGRAGWSIAEEKRDACIGGQHLHGADHGGPGLVVERGHLQGGA